MKSKHKNWAALTASTLGLTGLASAANLGEKYTYDGSGNIVEKSIDGQVTKMSYDASNKVTSVSSSVKEGVQVNYDVEGRPTAYKDCEGNITRQLKYGYAGKVVRVESTGREANFFYNAEGQLVGNSVAGETTSYAWDGNVLAAEGVTVFTNEAHFTGGVPVLESKGDIVISDYLANTLALGEKRFSNTAYGEGLEDGRFTGKPYVKELDTFVFKHRNYSANDIRWASADPLGFPDGKNQYSYVLNDPLNHIDPFGTNITFTGFPYDPNPPSVPDTETSQNVDVVITAHQAKTINSTQNARTLIAAKNPSIPVSQRYVPSSVATINGTLTVSYYKAKIRTAGRDGGGDLGAIFSGLPGLGTNEKYHLVQDITSNSDGPNGATNYMDGYTRGHPYLMDEANGSTVIPYCADFSRRLYVDLKSCGGSVDNIEWSSDTHIAVVDATALTIKFPADASFNWSWDIKEK
jgi:RHS repeat-associated protein